ncbi:MAG: AAA family ATPase, partial [Sulfurovum sp.]
KALKIREKVLGKNHPNTLVSYEIKDLIVDKLFFIKETKLFFSKKAKVDKVEIKNFKLLKDFKIDFTQNINIIIGENSSGKTSLLQAITLGILEKNYIGEFNDYEKYITKTEKQSNIKLSFGKYEKEVKIFENRRDIDKDFFPFVLAYGSNIFTMYDLNVDNIVGKILDNNIKRNFTDSIFKDYTDRFHNPKLILNTLARKEDDNAKEVENTIRDTINYFIDDFQLEKDENNQYAFRCKQGNIFKLINLSEGFRNSILLISDIVIRLLGTGRDLDSNGVILIDEFDRHLHPKWQSNLISKLEKKFPNIQFILTTHNPMSILDREADEISILREIDGKIVAEKTIGTKNIDVGTVLLKYFGVESLVGEEMQEKIRELSDLKLQGDLSEEEYKKLDELEDYFEYTPATNFIYNRAYFNFLIFLKHNKEIDFRDYEKMKDEDMVQLMERFKDLF